MVPVGEGAGPKEKFRGWGAAGSKGMETPSEVERLLLFCFCSRSRFFPFFFFFFGALLGGGESGAFGLQVSTSTHSSDDESDRGAGLETLGATAGGVEPSAGVVAGGAATAEGVEPSAG